MKNHLNRVLNLVRKTGDTMIVVDKDTDDAFVVMDLDQYELMLDTRIGYEDEWQDEDFNENIRNDSEVVVQPPQEADIWNVMQGAEDDGETWDINQLSEGEFAELEKQYQAFVNRHVEEVIDQNKTEIPIEEPEVESTEQKKLEIEKNEMEDEYGEEQFYLEPIE